MASILKIVQLIFSIALIGLVLLQQRGTGLSGLFGGTGEFYATRRGIEKVLFIGTLVIASLLLASVLASFLVAA